MTRSRLLFLALTLALLAVTACGGASDSTSGGSSTDKGSKSLSLVAYSTPQVVYDEIIPAFQKTGDGEGVGFKSSFGASGEQSRAVEAGLKADVVSFSIEPDMTRLVDAGLVAKDWDEHPDQGSRHDLGRLLHRPQGQPEEHQDVGRPGQAGRRGPDARTRSRRAPPSGTCWRATAPRATAARTRRRASPTCAS